jgi:hypothetical protein
MRVISNGDYPQPRKSQVGLLWEVGSSPINTKGRGAIKNFGGIYKKNLVELKNLLTLQGGGWECVDLIFLNIKA